MTWLMKILRAIYEHWLTDWRDNRKLFWLEFIGTCGSVGGTVTLSVFIKSSPLFLAYSFWLIGSTLIMIGDYYRNASWLFVLMFFNTIMNIVGITLLIV